MKSLVSCLVVIALCIVPALRADVPDPDPQVERKSFNLDPNFEINLFASDPMIRKPIEMNWDGRNRMWVATSETYPQLKPGEIPNDKIYILEDTQGAGKADKSTIFADGLFLPNAVIPGDGGAYVTNSTEILFLKDSKGTGKADIRRVVLSGFGTEDTHHIVHTLRWGVDGKLYFLQSLYIHALLETPRGRKMMLAAGVWRYDTRTLDLDIYSRGLINPWGLVWDRWGQTFETDGAGGQGINHSFPGAAFESAVGAERYLPGLNPHSPKYCSEEILSGRGIPDDYQGDILTNDFRANRIVRFKLSDNGATYTSRQMPDFLTSTDTAFRPVDIKMGPDGAIYIADWYNPIIQHGEVDFRDPRRDHVHGRIWRITAKGRSALARPKIDGASISQLLELLKAPEDYTRQQARLALRERDPKQVMTLLRQWVNHITSSDSQADHDRLEALWTCQNLDVIEPALLELVLKSQEPRARAAATRVAGYWAAQLPDAIKLIAPMVDDSYPRTRLEAVRALARIQSDESLKVDTRVLEHPMDPVLDYALWLTCNDLAAVWVPAFEQGKLSDWTGAGRNYALRAVKSPVAAKVLVEQLKSGQLTPQEWTESLDLIADIGGPEQAKALFEMALTDSAQRPALLKALLVMSAHGVPPPKDSRRIQELLSEPDAQRLSGQWKIAEIRPRLIEVASDPHSTEANRAAAIDGLAKLGGIDSIDALKKLSSAPTPTKIRRIAIGGLSQLNGREAARCAAQLIEAGDDDPAAVMAAVLARDSSGRNFPSALQRVKIPRDTAKLALRYLQSSTHQDPKLMAVFSQAAGISTDPVKLTSDEMKQMIEEVQSKGNAARGEQVFRRADTNCYQCHSIAGAGGWLSPDLSSIGATAQLDYLINSVLDPNKDIKDGYDGLSVLTKSGDIYSGIKVTQDSKNLVLRDNDHQAITIPLADIQGQKSIGSLMPNGLASTLTHQEFLDLIKFLSELGKPGPYGPTASQFIRRWQLSDSMSPRSNGTTAFSLISGTLPADSIGKSVRFARGEVEMTAPGKIRILVNGTHGLQLWVDEKPTQLTNEVGLDLPRGIHRLTLKVDPQVRAGEGLRVEIADAPGTTGHAQVMGGK